MEEICEKSSSLIKKPFDPTPTISVMYSQIYLPILGYYLMAPRHATK